LVLIVAASTAALALVAPATAAAEGTPAIALEKTAPAQALIGTQQEVHLTASNPAGQERGDNLTFRDVLPKGVVYVPDPASPVVPRVIENAPNLGETTLIFENVADLSANSHYTLNFKVEALPAVFKITKLHEYTDHAEAFVDGEPRLKPNFNAKGEVVVGSFTGKGKAEATTELTAVEIVKSEPSPEGEIMRGLHEHQTVYTLTLKNNRIGPTGELEVEDLLPAGLEFLGCGTVDHTTATKTNPSSTEEYPGSGPIDPGNAPAAPKCAGHEPYFVATVSNPPGHPAGVYTQVKWKDLGTLAAGEEMQIQYVAAIPILKNEPAFIGGVTPSPEGLEQVANLANNTGPETVDEEALTNYAEVDGKYEGVKVKDTDEMTRTAEDLSIQKSVTPTKIEEGEESTWTLDLESSEYRFVNGVQIEDLLPNGLCPLGKENFEGPKGTPTETTEECEPVVGVEPTYEIVGNPLGPQPADYTSVEEQSDGTFKIHWDDSTLGALAQLVPSEHLILHFPTRTRTFYQDEFKNSTPVLTGDSWTNHVETKGDDFARCAPGDPICTLAQPKIFTEEPEGTPDEDVSAASQEAGGVEIDKTVRENEGAVPEDCSGKYVQGTEAPLPLYSPGDEICWTLRVKFAAKLFAGAPVVTDFIPTDEEYVQGSAAPVEPPDGENTLEATFNEAAAASEESLEWTLGKAVESGTQIFEWRFKTKVKKERETKPEEITGNLMKFVYGNTLGETFPLRDRAEVERQEPDISLLKGVTEVNGKGVVGAPATGVTVGGGDTVTYRLDVENTGNMDAEEGEVWDVLPEGIDCSDLVGTPEPAPAVCEVKTIKWTNVAIAEGGTTSLSYEVKVPTDVAPGHKFVNHAGVTRYKTPTNSLLGKFEYIPAENLNPAAGPPNTEPILANAEILTTKAGLKKEATTETNQGIDSGNEDKEATIGEIIDYKVKATVPANSKIYGTPVLTDELPSNLELVGGTVAVELDEAALPSGVTLEPLPNGAAVKFSGPYPEVPSAEAHTLVLTFKARVLDVGANVRTATITNEAAFEFEGKEESATVTTRKAKAETTVVEPNLEVEKNLLPKARSATVEPGEEVEYEVTATDVEGTDVSTANNVILEDTIPAGMKVVDAREGEEVGGKIRWQLANIEPGQSVSRTYVLEVEEPANAASKFVNEVTGKTQSLPGPIGGSPPAGSRTYEAEDAAEVRLIPATVSKEVTEEKGTIGTELTYTLHMNLLPQITYFDTTMVDQLPKGVTFDKTVPVSTECKGEGCEEPSESEPELFAEEAGPEGTTLLGWLFGKFEFGKARELVVKFNAYINAEAANGNKPTNSLAGYYDEAPTELPPELPPELPIPGSKSLLFSEETNVAEAGTEVFEPKLKLTKSVSGAFGEGKIAVPGIPLSYTLTIKNEGEWPAYDFNVEDTPGARLVNVTPGPTGPGITAPTGEPLVWHVDGPLAAGGELKLTYTAELEASEELKTGDEVKNVAEIPSYFGLPEPERAEAEVFRKYGPLEVDKKLEVELPQITLEKTTGKPGHAEGEEADVGEPFPWRIVVKNTAAFAGAKEAVVEDELPANWTYKTGSATVGGTHVEPTNPAGTQTLIWTLPALAAATETEILFEATPGPTAIHGTNINHAIVRAKDESGAAGGKGDPYEASGEASAEVVAPDLEVVKTALGTAVAGGEAEYTIEVTNTGGGAATAPIEVKDKISAGQEYLEPSSLPAGVTQISVNPPPVAGPATIVWTIASLEPGESVVIPVPIKVPPSDSEGEKIEDEATVESPQAPTPKIGEASFIVKRETDRAIEKIADRPTVNGGENINYTLTAKNLGLSDGTGVTVTDDIPAGTTFVKATEPGCSFAAGKVTCLAGNVKAGHEVPFQVEVEVESGRTTAISNTAKITGTEFDPEPNNDEKTITTSIGSSADLSIEKTGPSQPVLLGNTFKYKLEVKNEGPSDAEFVEVIDRLRGEVEFIEATAPAGTTCTEAGGRLACELGTLVSKSAPVTIEVTVKAVGLPATGMKAVNRAEVVSETPDPKPSNNESTAETEILPAADLAITKTAPATVEPNGELTYELQVEDLGPSAAHHVVVSDSLPAGVNFVKASEGCAAAAGVVTCEVQPGGELTLSQVADFQVTVQVPFALGGQPLTNTASVTSEEADPHSENNQSTVTTTVGPDADLSITKTMGKAQAGKPLTYTLAITNHGPSAASAVTVNDTLPAGTTFTSAAPSQGTCSAVGQAVTCRLGALAAGGSAQVQVTVEVAATATGSLRNVATVEGPEPDPDKSNNESAVEGPVAPAPPSDPNLRVVKTADTSTPQVGTPFDYHVAVSNLAPGAGAKNVKVVDTLNGPVKVLSIEAESGHCDAAGSKITCRVPSIPVGKTVHISYSVVAESAGTLSNTASAQAANGEKVPGNNHAVKSVKAKAAALAPFTLAKTASRKIVAGGKTVGFTITLRNGSAALTGAKVCDRLPAALVFVKAAGSRYVNGEACWQQKFVGARQVLRLHLVARAVQGYKSRRARNVATASAENAVARSAAAIVRIKPAFAGAPGGVTG
jgi:large repetitive protein